MVTFKLIDFEDYVKSNYTEDEVAVVEKNATISGGNVSNSVFGGLRLNLFSPIDFQQDVELLYIYMNMQARFFVAFEARGLPPHNLQSIKMRQSFLENTYPWLKNLKRGYPQAGKNLFEDYQLWHNGKLWFHNAMIVLVRSKRFEMRLNLVHQNLIQGQNDEASVNMEIALKFLDEITKYHEKFDCSNPPSYIDHLGTARKMIPDPQPCFINVWIKYANELLKQNNNPV